LFFKYVCGHCREYKRPVDRYLGEPEENLFEDQDLFVKASENLEMPPRRDPRLQSTKAKISWNPAWMAERDAQGDLLSDWAVKSDYQSFKCRWCQKVCCCFAKKNHVPSIQRPDISFIFLFVESKERDSIQTGTKHGIKC
jgi:hypothetical protein